MAPADTINVAEPLLPLDAAVIVTEPACDAVTRPLEETVPMEVLELDHEIGIPVTTFPAPSLSVAESCCVLPAARPSDPGVIATVATEPAPTFIDAVALFPSDVAVIVAPPTCTPVTRPLVETEATLLLELCQATARPVSVLPPASVACADSCTVLPAEMVLEDGVIESAATGAETTPSEELSAAVEALATIFALPIAVAVTSPLDETVT